MMNKKSIISIFLIFLLFPNIIFAATYTEADMSGREMVYDADGTAYVAYGEAVKGTNYQGGLHISENYQDANGNLHKVRRRPTCFSYKF